MKTKRRETKEMMPRSIVGMIIGAILLIVAFSSLGLVCETNTAGYFQVKQAAITGNLTCKMEPGMYSQLFGDIFTYPEAATFYFSKPKEQQDEDKEQSHDQSIETRFYDGAKAWISGSVRVLMPSDCESLVRLHRKFHSIEGVMNKLVLPAVYKSLYNTGAHMTSAESYAERRAEFAAIAEDQLLNGVYLTDQKTVEFTDEITGEKKTRQVIVIRKDTQGEPIREQSAFKDFNMRLTNFVIDGIEYTKEVLAQIEQQRTARMNIITQQAQGKEAEARAAKAKFETSAQIEETRATEEVAKTQRIVKAEADKAETILEYEKKKAAAQLDMEAAELERRASILRGEGESTRRRLIMQADGALSQKLETWLKAQQAYANALSQARPGALVPSIVMGGQTGLTANDWLGLIGAKTARDLALEMQVKANP